MAAERRTLAFRSGFVPKCALISALFGGGLLSACLNPLPEEFPTRDRGAVVTEIDLGPGAGGGPSADPTGSAGNAGGATGLIDTPEAPQQSGGDDGALEDASGAPDAGADAAAPPAEPTTEGDTEP
jgi:hypothetical protein